MSDKYGPVFIDPSKCDESTRRNLDGVIVGELSGYTRPGHCLVHIDNERSLWLPVDALSSEPPQAALFDLGA